MTIGYLADYPEFFPTVAHWHHEEWSHLHPDESLDGRMARLRKCCNHGQIPTVLMAFSGGVLYGSAMLVANDMETRMQWSPWLVGVFVNPDHRRRGMGARLVRRVVEEARILTVRRLYLYTPSAEHFYSRPGWTLVERTNYRGADVAIMSCECPIQGHIRTAMHDECNDLN